MIRWTDEERAMLLTTAAELLHKGVAFSKLSALEQAQNALPLTRRRHLKAVSQVPWYVERLPAALLALKEVKLPEPSPEPLPKVLEETQEQVPTRLQAAFADLYEALRDEVSNTVIKALEQSVAGSISGALPSNQKSPLPSVLVVGLRGGQMQEIKDSFGKLLDLRFIGSDENKHMLRHLSAVSDVTVGLTSFLSHSGEAIIKSRSARYVPVDGGMTRLKDALGALKANSSSSYHPSI